jgi:ribosomal RNA assembly protein
VRNFISFDRGIYKQTFKNNNVFLQNYMTSNTTFTHDLKIPKDRIAVIIGKDGVVKKELEELTKTSIFIDSKEGDVRLSSVDSIQLYILKDVIKAIGRGFNPEIAKQLLKTDFVLELIPLTEYAKNPNQLPRIKGRVIGKDGRARETIQELTETSISVYGKTVAIIGFCDNVAICKRAVESLLTGSPHSSIFKWLEKHRKQQKYDQFTGF